MVQRFNVLQNVFGRDEYEMSLNENGYWVKWKDVAPILADALKPSTNDAMVSASQISAAADEWADGNPNRFGVNGFVAGAEWMRQKLHQ